MDRKRKLNQQDESNEEQSVTRKPRHDVTPGSHTDTMLSAVKIILKCVLEKLPYQGNEDLYQFLKDTISDLGTDRREMVGVFGKTGAGKSSLINAVIGQENLLPSGKFSACTSAVIQVETNMQSQKYEAEIEFIKKEEWESELINLLRKNAAQDVEDDECVDTAKLTSLYGEEGWKDKSPEDLMDNRYFREIPEFLESKTKTLISDSAKDLSEKCAKYTRNGSRMGAAGEDRRWHWPLVKRVTVRVPGNDLLQHVTLVDLPGCGDRNESRNKMWKDVVGNCSTVWIVTDVNRAVAEREPWDILKHVCSLMGNGGQCQQIHFICTKTDTLEDSEDGSVADLCKEAKEAVTNEFKKLDKVKKHFSEKCLEVFTVSSRAFLRKTAKNPNETEIPILQKILQTRNNSLSEALVKETFSGAYGILSLIKGARHNKVVDKEDEVTRDLKENIKHQLDEVRKPLEETQRVFEECLSEGVEGSKLSWERLLKSVIHPDGVKGGAFHRTLKCVVQNNGTYTPKNKEPICLNEELASCLYDSIDEEFRKTFPNEDGNHGPFDGVIKKFSLDTKALMEKYKDVKLQLIFLQTEEDKIKTKLNKLILDRKKEIYWSPTTTIEEAMQECYDNAAGFSGPGTLKNMRDAIENHVRYSKDTMFESAKDEMLQQLHNLKEEILETLEKTLLESVGLSLEKEVVSIPDVTEELALVKKYCRELNVSLDEDDAP